MKRAARHRVVLLAGVALLIALVAWQIYRDRQAAPGALLELDPGAITHVDLQIPLAPAEHYMKRDGHWWRIDRGRPIRADDLRLGELVNVAAAPVEDWRDADAYDDAKIGLQPPQATLILDGHAVIFGGMTAIGRSAYVQVGQRIGVVSLRYMPRSAQSKAVKAL